jgi:hypothetical protein
MCYIDGQKNKYSVLNECNRMPKYNIFTAYLPICCCLSFAGFYISFLVEEDKM